MNRLLTLCLLLISTPAWAQLQVADIFGDGMVLQREKPLPVWGRTHPGMAVEVMIGGMVGAGKANAKGEWKIWLPPQAANAKGDSLVVKSGSERIVFKNVLIGDVWLASGQSNMEWPLERADNGPQAKAAANFPEIRLYRVPKRVSRVPVNEARGTWQLCSPKTAAGFSAVAYFFGKEIHQTQGVPIGLIGSYWGGTPSEAWTSLEMLAGHADFRESIGDIQDSQEDFEALFQAQQVHRNSLLEVLDEVEKKDARTYAQVDYNDQDWPEMKVPIHFHNTPIAGFQGMAWMRKHFTLNAAQSKKDITLVLGKIEQVDRSYVNGEGVGETYQTHLPRRYTVPARHLHAGKNVVAVRVKHLRSGGGGLYEGPFLILQGADTLADLAGPWRYNHTLEHDPPPVNQVFQHMPGTLFNGMIAPLIPFAIKGVIWYQGENNGSRAYQYRDIFPKLIHDWRIQWGQGSFPFLFVQLANWLERKPEPKDDAWAELREAQTMTLSLPQTGMAVTIDIGEADDIHPRNKQDVGHRLALAARHISYEEELVYSGPRLAKQELMGDHLILTFEQTGAGLATPNKEAITGFALAGKDGTYHWAKAEIIAPNQLKVWTKEVPHPKTVRYAWARNPDCNLYNKEGLPAVPFRTDQFSGLTMGNK